MKVLVTGYHNPHYPTITEYIERAVEALGHEIIAIDEGRYLFPGRLRQRLAFLENIDIRHFNARVLHEAGECNPHVALMLGGERIQRETIERLSRRGIVTTLWTVDAPVAFEPVLRSAAAYDHVFCQGTEAIEILQGVGIASARWLPMACDPEFHQPVALTASEQTRYAHDVVFVGSHYPERETWFEALSGVDLAIWGPGWEKVRDESPLKRSLRGAHTPPLAWGKIYSAAQIVLSVHFQDPEGRFAVHQASPRVFEAMACGAFVITDRQRDVLALFREGEHLVMADEPEELREKVRYYLDHAGERERIARRGREEVIRRHTYIQRLESLLGAVCAEEASAGAATGAAGGHAGR